MNAPQPSTGETRTAPERLLKVTKLSKPSSRRVLAALIGGAPAARDRQPMGWSRRVSLRRAAAVGVECFTVVGLVGERRLRSLDGTMVGRQEAMPWRSACAAERGEEGRVGLFWCGAAPRGVLRSAVVTGAGSGRQGVMEPGPASLRFPLLPAPFLASLNLRLELLLRLLVGREREGSVGAVADVSAPSPSSCFEWEWADLGWQVEASRSGDSGEKTSQRFLEIHWKLEELELA